MTASQPISESLLESHPTPIAQLNPDISDQATRVVQGVITVTWPFSIVTKSIAFILAERDPRLRREKGQVRIRFNGGAAKAISEATVGGGDEICISLDGAKWERHESRPQLADSTLEWQIEFTNRLLLKIQRTDPQEIKTINLNLQDSINGVEESHASDHIPDVTVAQDATPSNLEIPTPSSPEPPISAKRTASTALEPQEYASPAFVKRARVSYGALFEGGFDIFDEDDGRKSKSKRRPRFSMNSHAWRYSSRSPSPEPVENSDRSSDSEGQDVIRMEPQTGDQTPKAAPKPTMVDEGCQTMDVDFTPMNSVQVSAESRSLLPFPPSTPTPLPRTGIREAEQVTQHHGSPFGEVVSKGTHEANLFTTGFTEQTTRPLGGPVGFDFATDQVLHPMIPNMEPVAHVNESASASLDHTSRPDDYPDHFLANQTSQPTSMEIHPSLQDPQLPQHAFDHPTLPFTHEPQSYSPYPPLSQPADTTWTSVGPSMPFAFGATSNDAQNPMEILDSSSPVRERLRNEEERSESSEEREKLQDRLDQQEDVDVEDDLSERNRIISPSEVNGETDFEDGGDRPGDDYDLRNYDSALEDDDDQGISEEDLDPNSSDVEAQVIDPDAEDESDQDDEEEDIEDYDRPISSTYDQPEEYEGSEIEAEEYDELEDEDEGEYYEDEYYDEDEEEEEEEEHAAPPGASAPQEPVFISLLSDSEDEPEPEPEPEPEREREPEPEPEPKHEPDPRLEEKADANAAEEPAGDAPAGDAQIPEPEPEPQVEEDPVKEIQVPEVEPSEEQPSVSQLSTETRRPVKSHTVEEADQDVNMTETVTQTEELDDKACEMEVDTAETATQDTKAVSAAAEPEIAALPADGSDSESRQPALQAHSEADVQSEKQTPESSVDHETHQPETTASQKIEGEKPENLRPKAPDTAFDEGEPQVPENLLEVDANSETPAEKTTNAEPTSTSSITDSSPATTEIQSFSTQTLQLENLEATETQVSSQTLTATQIEPVELKASVDVTEESLVVTDQSMELDTEEHDQQFAASGSTEDQEAPDTEPNEKPEIPQDNLEKQALDKEDDRKPVSPSPREEASPAKLSKEEDHQMHIGAAAVETLAQDTVGQLPTPGDTQQDIEMEDDYVADGNRDDEEAEAQIVAEFLQYSPIRQQTATAKATQPSVGSSEDTDVLSTVKSLRSRGHKATKSFDFDFDPSVLLARGTKHASEDLPDSIPGSSRVTRSKVDHSQDPSIALARSTAPPPSEEGSTGSPAGSFRITRSKADHSEQDPSVRLAQSPAPMDSQESSPSGTIRVTRSKADHSSDPSVQLARAPAPSTRQTRRQQTPDVSHEAKASPQNSQRGATPDAALASRKSPSVASSILEDENVNAVKLQLLKGLRTSLPEYLTFKSLRNSLNKTADFLAVVTTAPSQPHRPKHGPRDYMLTLNLTDPSVAPTGVSVAHIFRPHQTSLPTVHAGDIVLLRRFQVVSMKGRGYGIRAGDASAWAVFEKADEEMLPQIKGPPVEVTDEEIKYVEGLKKWWHLLDEKAMDKLDRASRKASEAGKEDLK